jgi:hypothetical protein
MTDRISTPKFQVALKAFDNLIKTDERLGFINFTFSDEDFNILRDEKELTEDLFNCFLLNFIIKYYNKINAKDFTVLSYNFLIKINDLMGQPEKLKMIKEILNGKELITKRHVIIPFKLKNSLWGFAIIENFKSNFKQKLKEEKEILQKNFLPIDNEYSKLIIFYFDYKEKFNHSVFQITLIAKLEKYN